MEQEHRLSYKAGITRTPSDFLCADGELAECINLATDNEELKPMVQPAAVMTLNTPGGHWPTDTTIRVLYIHKYNSETRYIVAYCMSTGQSPWYLKWTNNGYDLNDLLDESGHQMSSIDLQINITSIGKTLIMTDDDGIHYYLWKESSYKSLGDIPEQDVDFWLVCPGETWTEPYKYGTLRTNVRNTGDAEGMIGVHKSPRSFEVIKQDEYNDLIVGLYYKNLKEIASLKKFCRPFFIRTAIELYDGSYMHISQPILMFPCVTENSYAKLNRIYASQDTRTISLFTNYSELHYNQKIDYTDWSDIVKGVTVFITDGIEVHKLNVDQYPNSDDGETATPTTCVTDGVFRESNSDISHYFADEFTIEYPIDESYWFTCQVLRKKDKKDIINDIKGISRFYKLCNVDFKPSSGDIGSCFSSVDLENLTTQEWLEYDDYFSFTKLRSKFSYAYNSRLNIANVNRSFFGGFQNFMPLDNNYTSTYTFYVRIKTDTGEVWISHTTPTAIKQMQGCYFYYPDPRANRVVIRKQDGLGNNYFILDKDLKEHPGLNGAYYLKGLPGIDFTNDDGSITPQTDPTSLVNNSASEQLSNYLIQSEVNNPWLFNARGYHKVSIGEIEGMSTITQALSQNQHGPSPLLVFTKNGVYSMSVDNTGLYDYISNISREVCINPGSILQTDNAVFFVSKKGLMAAVQEGSYNNIVVHCVSEQMNGKTFNTNVLSPLATGTDWATIVSACQDSTSFLDYIRSTDLFMAYDYIDSRIIITKPGKGYSFAYNIADGTISKVILPAAMTNAVNNYPDYLLQGTVTEVVNNQTVTVNKLYSFYEKQREEEVASRQLGFLLTRPMKLAGPVSQASLRQLKNVGTWKKKDAGGNELSCVKTELYLSEDMQTWFPDISRHGAAARYYRLALYIKMLPTERLSGTILTEQPRRSNNMR